MIAAVVASTAVAQKIPDNGYWKATSNTAHSITGDIGIAGERLSVYFQPITIAQIRELTPDEIAAAFNFDADAQAKGNLYRMNIPGDRKFLHKNTLCGNEDTQWMATAVSGKTLQVAFFSGNMMPVMKPEVLNNATNLCGTFTYSR